jgi:phage terminase small subunit
MDVVVGDFGPAMRGLTELQQKFVLAMFSSPLSNATRWVKLAGFTAANGNVARVTAHRLMHDPKIAAAVQEFAGQHLSVVGPALSLGVMMKIARTRGHKDQFKAAAAIANRSGFHETTEHRVTVDHRDQTGDAVIERIKAAAAKLGVDPAVLLGQNAAVPMKLIEGVSRETEQQDG